MARIPHPPIDALNPATSDLRKMAKLTAEQIAERGKAAAAVHDDLNVKAIFVLVALTLLCAMQPSPITHKLLSYAALVYTMGDTLYHFAIPHCQPTTLRLATILLHHLATAVLLLHPLMHPPHAAYTMHCMSVEVNTLIHNANKVYKGRSAALDSVITAAFYATWFGLRLGYSPYLIFAFHRDMLAIGASPWSFDYLRVVGAHACISFLNFFWTVEMASKMLLAKGKKKE